MRSWGECEEADDRRVEEIAKQLEEIEQTRVSADWANNREHDDRRIEANVGGPPPSNIREYLDELIKSFALCPPIRPSALKTLYDRRDYPAMLGWIKDSMRLDLQVGLRIVDRPRTSPPMWIELPERMPTVGTAEFNRTSVTVNVCRDILKTKPFSWVVAGFAHELSHVVLSSVRHRLQHDEKAVELTAMILGYQRYIGDAEVTETKFSWSLMLLFGVMYWRDETWRLGYLTSTEARAARKYLAKIEHAQKSKVGSSTPSSDGATSASGIAAFIAMGGVATFLIVMLPFFFQGKGTDAARPQGAADSSVQANPNKLNPPPDDIVAAQIRLIELRFLKGPADGVWGTKSRMALRAFKIANGLSADDKWDDLVSGRLYSTKAARSPLPLATTSPAQ